MPVSFYRGGSERAQCRATMAARTHSPDFLPPDKKATPNIFVDRRSEDERERRKGSNRRQRQRQNKNVAYDTLIPWARCRRFCPSALQDLPNHAAFKSVYTWSTITKHINCPSLGRGNKEWINWIKHRKLKCYGCNLIDPILISQ